MIYRVPLQPDDYIEGNGYYFYKGSEMSVDTVECSNKLILINVYRRMTVYIDLENGNVVSGYRPGGTAFLLGNLIDFYDRNNYLLEKPNMIYWLESYCMAEHTLEAIGEMMAENPKSSTLLGTVLLPESDYIGDAFVKYLKDCASFIQVMKDVFFGRKSRIKEYRMLLSASDAGEEISTIYSYLRARNKDFKLLFCREDDSYYVKIANDLGVGNFRSKNFVVMTLRSINMMANSKLVKVLACKDESPSAELHDFALDLEKLNQVLKKI